MFVSTRQIVAALAMTGTLGLGGVVATQTTVRDGLVNVAVGDVNVLNNANIGVAAQVAANVCGLKVGPVAVLGTIVDRTGQTRTVCTSGDGPVTLRQNQ